jgi:hypothetical protein
MEEIKKILNGDCLYTVTRPYEEFCHPDRMAPDSCNSTVRGGEHFVPELQFPEECFILISFCCSIRSHPAGNSAWLLLCGGLLLKGLSYEIEFKYFDKIV